MYYHTMMALSPVITGGAPFFAADGAFDTAKRLTAAMSEARHAHFPSHHPDMAADDSMPSANRRSDRHALCCSALFIDGARNAFVLARLPSSGLIELGCVVS